MEWKNKRKKHLTARILLNITIVLTVSMLISTMISYIYFEKIVREQAVSDEKSRMDRTVSQIEVIKEDLYNFAVSIIADENMQLAMTDSGPVTTFDQVKRKDTISKRLVFFNGLRLFINGSFVELEGGEVFSSNKGYQAEYMETKLQTPELLEYKAHPEWVFSNPYDGIDTWALQQLICYRVNIRDVYNTDRRKGTLYLEIDQDYLLAPVQQYGAEYDNIWLIGNEGNVLYENSEQEIIQKLMQSYPACASDGIHKIREGYLLSQEVKGSGWRLCVLITSQELWAQSSFVFRFFFLSLLISVAAILAVVSRSLRRVIAPISSLSEQMSQTDYENLSGLEAVQTNDEIQTLYECYNNMIEEIHQGIEDRIAYEKQHKQMEFEILLSQIHPHYLYNVLNTVVYLASAGKNKEVVRIAQSLIYSLQETLRLGEKNIETTIEKEIELLNCYLDIQKYRYPDLFEVEICCDDSCKDQIVPKTIIQPLVENAIVHGVLPTEEKGLIQVRMKAEEKFFCIAVEDNGMGIEEERLQMFEQGELFIDNKNGRVHIGVSNIRDRIAHLYGEPYGMQMERREEGGTRVVLRLPVNSRKEL